MQSRSGSAPIGNVLALACLLLLLAVIGGDLLLKQAHEAKRQKSRQAQGQALPGWTPAYRTQEEIPDFTLPDEKGRRRSLSEFRGKPTLLAFYTGDPRCEIFAREVEKIRSHVGAAKMNLVSVVMFSREEAARFKQATGSSSLFLFESPQQHPIRDRFRAEQGPAGYVLSARGRVQYAVPPVTVSGVPEEQLSQVTEAIRVMIPPPEPDLVPIPDPVAEMNKAYARHRSKR